MWSFLEKNGLLGQRVAEEVNIRDLSDKAVVNLAKFFTLDDALAAFPVIVQLLSFKNGKKFNQVLTDLLYESITHINQSTAKGIKILPELLEKLRMFSVGELELNESLVVPGLRNIKRSRVWRALFLF